MSCELPRYRADDSEIRGLLRSASVVAVVGLSGNPDRDSHRVAKYLRLQGYRVIPVNPNETEVLGERAFASLREVPDRVDIVDVFRRPEAVPEVVEDAVAVGAGAIWLQEGVVHNEAAGRALGAGLKVVMNRCIMKEHRRLVAAGL